MTGGTGSEDFALAKAAPGSKQKLVVLRLQAAREEKLLWKQVDADSSGASKGGAGKVVEATGPATVRTFLEFLKAVSAEVGVEPSHLFGELDLAKHLRGCFAQYWRRTDLEYRFQGLRQALVDFYLEHRPQSIVEVKRFLQMWLSHGSGEEPNFQPEKTDTEREIEAHEEKEREQEEWAAEALRQKYSERTADEAKKKWVADRKKAREDVAARQKAEDEDTEVSVHVNKVLFSSEANSKQANALGQKLVAEIDKELRTLCRALEETYATPPGTFLSRVMLEEPCIIPTAKPIALVSTNAAASAAAAAAAAAKSPRDKEGGGASRGSVVVAGAEEEGVKPMNFTEVIAIWPTVRRIVVGSPDPTKHKKMIDDPDDEYSLVNLLKKGLPVESKPFGYSMLYLACAQGNKALIALLAAHGANLHALSKDRVLPIEVAAMMGEFKVVEQLLKDGSYFGSAMHYAAAAGQPLVVRELLAVGMDPCIGHVAPGATKDKSPLELAVMHEQAPVVHVLWNYLKQWEADDDDDAPPENAVDAARTDMLEQAKKDAAGGGALPTSPVKKKTKARREKAKLLGGNAAKRRTLFDRETARLPPNLRESKLLKNARRSMGADTDGGTASAGSTKNLNAAAAAAGGKAEEGGGGEKDDDGPPGDTIEDFAAVRDYLSGVSKLKPKNADAEDSLGWTSLCYAALFDDAAAARKLLLPTEQGGLQTPASHTHRNRHGFSAVMWARWQDSQAFLQVLRELRGPSACRPDGTEENGIAMLNDMIERNFGDETIRKLLRIHIDPAEKALKEKTREQRRARRAESTKEMVEYEKAQSQKRQGTEIEAVQGIDEMLQMVVFDPADKPAMSLEAYLIWLGAESEYAGLYPEKGLFKGDMKGFINSCKACTMDVIAANANVNVNAVDVFALHLYTRAELHQPLNAAYRPAEKDKSGKSRDAEQALAQRLWRPVVWYIATAHSHLKAKPGLYFRGVNKLYSWLSFDAYAPSKMIKFASFSSSTSDLRVAGRFMYGDMGALDRAALEGVIFKIWAKTPVAIDWCSYVPQEKEHLFNPETRFKVLAWYQATSANLWRGMRMEQRGLSTFLLPCDFVESVPLLPLTEQKDSKKQEDELRAALGDAKVLLIELEEILLTDEEKQKIEETKDKARKEALAALKRAIADATAKLDGSVRQEEADAAAAAAAASSDARDAKDATLPPSRNVSAAATTTLSHEQDAQLNREQDLRAVQGELAKRLTEAEHIFSDQPVVLREQQQEAKERLRMLKRQLREIATAKLSAGLQNFKPLLIKIQDRSDMDMETIKKTLKARAQSFADAAEPSDAAGDAAAAAVPSSPGGGGGGSPGASAAAAASSGVEAHSFMERMEELEKLEEIITFNPSMSNEREKMEYWVGEVRRPRFPGPASPSFSHGPSFSFSHSLSRSPLASLPHPIAPHMHNMHNMSHGRCAIACGCACSRRCTT